MAALGFDPLLIGVYIVNFVIVLVALQRLAYKPVREMLEKRQKEISSGLSAASEAQEQAAMQRAKFEQELTQARQASQEEARKTAEATERMRQDILAAAEKEAEQIKARAREEAEQERQQVGEDMHQQVAELSMLITRKVIGEGVDEKSQRQLVDRFLAELGDIS